MRKFQIAVRLLILVMVAAGCSKQSSKSSSGAAPTKLTSAAEILKAKPSDIPALESAARSGSTAALRYMALRRLEELNDPQLVAIARELAREPLEPGGSRLLRNNAVGVLSRAEVRGDVKARGVLDELAAEGEFSSVITALRAAEIRGTTK